jgi:hypothetical protein
MFETFWQAALASVVIFAAMVVALVAPMAVMSLGMGLWVMGQADDDNDD